MISTSVNPLCKFLTALTLTLVTVEAFAPSPSSPCKRQSPFALGPIARNGLVYEDIEVGTGRRILPGDSVLCYYVGSFEKQKVAAAASADGNPFASFFSNGGSSGSNDVVVFDKTDDGEPFEFVVGKGDVIPGWEQGILGSVELEIPPMQIGGDRKLVIPSELAYGEAGAGGGIIPPNQDLQFQIAILNAEQAGGVSLGFRLGGYAVVFGFAATVLAIGWFVLHSL